MHKYLVGIILFVTLRSAYFKLTEAHDAIVQSDLSSQAVESCITECESAPKHSDNTKPSDKTNGDMEKDIALAEDIALALIAVRAEHYLENDLKNKENDLKRAENDLEKKEKEAKKQFNRTKGKKRESARKQGKQIRSEKKVLTKKFIKINNVQKVLKVLSAVDYANKLIDLPGNPVAVLLGLIKGPWGVGLEALFTSKSIVTNKQLRERYKELSDKITKDNKDLREFYKSYLDFHSKYNGPSNKDTQLLDELIKQKKKDLDSNINELLSNFAEFRAGLKNETELKKSHDELIAQSRILIAQPDSLGEESSENNTSKPDEHSYEIKVPKPH